jgi:hypothetical protein
LSWRHAAVKTGNLMVATAHKLARLLYAMIATRKPYDKSVGEAVAGASLERQISNLRKKAAKLGVTLNVSKDNKIPA